MRLLDTPTDAATAADYLQFLGTVLLGVGSILTLGLSQVRRSNRHQTPRESRKYRVMGFVFPVITLAGLTLMWSVAIASGRSPLQRCAPSCGKVWVLGVVLPVVALVLPLWLNRKK
jgi:hypothetical protein